MKVGIIGSGEVGLALAAGFLKHGHKVTIGTRDPAKLTEWAKKQKGVKVGFFTDAAQFGQMIVLAVKGSAAAEALVNAGTDNIRDKIIIDANNPIVDGAAPVNGVLPFFTTMQESLMEQLQARFPNARFVKAFNSVGSPFMVNPKFKGGKPTMFICGNDKRAKTAVTKILDQIGWETADMGKVESARAIEPLCMLWCLPGFLRNEWTHAFRLLRK
jgi:predicted dinucleotide-binding enzyme